jgi:type IV secretory pathway TrbF-like protein
VRNVAAAGAGDNRPAVREFVSRISEERKDKTAWRRVAFLLMIGYVIGIALLVYFAQLPRVEPFLIAYDSSTGAYIPIGPAKPEDPPGITSRVATIGRWLEDCYTVTDFHSQVNIKNRCFGGVKAGSQAYNAIHSYWYDPQRGPDAMRGAKLTYSITVENVDATDNQHFTADYTLRVFDDMNELRATENRHAQITAEWHPEISDPKILWANPDQLFVTQFIDGPAGNIAPLNTGVQQ